MTKIQLKLLTFIEVYYKKNNQSPTRQELADYLKCTRTNINFHLLRIEKKGLIKINRRKNRQQKYRNIILMRGGEKK